MNKLYPSQVILFLYLISYSCHPSHQDIPSLSLALFSHLVEVAAMTLNQREFNKPIRVNLILVDCFA